MAFDDKKLLVAGEKLLYGTSIDCKPEPSNETTKTFSGNIVQGLEDVPWTISAEKVQYDGAVGHLRLSMILEDMLTNKRMVTVREIVRPSGEDPYEIVDDFYNCLVTNNGYKVSADSNTVNNLEFKAERRERHYYTLDGAEITTEFPLTE